MSLQTLKLSIRRGETVNLPIRIESDVLVYRPITAMAQSAPARVTVAAHGIKDGWRAAVMNAKGMTELNASNPPRDSEMRRVGVVDPNTVEFNSVNAAGFRAYASGGQLVYYAPLDLAAFTAARMDVKDKVGGTVLLSLSTTDGSIDLDATEQVLWLRLADEVTATLSFKAAVFDIELLDVSGNVTAVCSAESVLTVLPEVTTSP